MPFFAPTPIHSEGSGHRVSGETDGDGAWVFQSNHHTALFPIHFFNQYHTQNAWRIGVTQAHNRNSPEGSGAA